MIGKSDSENVHSAFLRWIILSQKDCLNSSCNNIVLELLKCIRMRAGQQKKLEDKYFRNILSKLLDSKDVSYLSDGVDCECHLHGFEFEGKCGRVDLHIKGCIKADEKSYPIRIIIENKIYSKEYENQTSKYYAYFSNDLKYLEKKGIGYRPYKKHTSKQKYVYDEFLHSREENEIQVYAYLTLHSDKEMEVLYSKEGAVCGCEYFIHITYQDILDNIILPLIKSASILPRYKVILEEYAETIRLLYNNYELKGSLMSDNLSYSLLSNKKKEMENKDEILTLLRSCGMGAYVNYLYPALSKDYNVSILEMARMYPEFSKYSANAQNTRLSKARAIFSNGWEDDALEIITCSNADDKTKRRAKELLGYDSEI